MISLAFVNLVSSIAYYVKQESELIYVRGHIKKAKHTKIGIYLNHYRPF